VAKPWGTGSSADVTNDEGCADMGGFYEGFEAITPSKDF
jgi:hypothetical protein